MNFINGIKSLAPAFLLIMYVFNILVLMMVLFFFIWGIYFYLIDLEKIVVEKYENSKN